MSDVCSRTQRPLAAAADDMPTHGLGLGDYNIN